MLSRLVTAAVLFSCAVALRAEQVFYQIDIAPTGKVISQDLPVAKGNTIVFHRFIDWLAVFAQLGVLHLGRPMSIDDIRFVPPDRGTSRQLGYNDLHKG